jgi:hypothetical protein
MLGLALAAAPAWGVDGVIEINQARAAAGEITSCDFPGFPVTLCTSGSYRLTSNLDYPSALSSAIEVTVPDVSIDLNGMTIKGTNSCSIAVQGWVTTCSQSGSIVGDGIYAGILATRTRVFNGRINNAGRYGLALSWSAEVRDVQVSECASHGMVLGERANVTGVSAVSNGGRGIVIGFRSRLRDAVAAGNAGDGVVVGSGSAEGVTSESNANRGILLEASASLHNFAVRFSGVSGVEGGHGSLMDSGTVRDSDRSLTGSCGLQGGGGASYHAVVVTSNGGGANAATACGAVNLGSNSCQGGACPP